MAELYKFKAAPVPTGVPPELRNSFRYGKPAQYLGRRYTDDENAELQTPKHFAVMQAAEHLHWAWKALAAAQEADCISIPEAEAELAAAVAAL